MNVKERNEKDRLNGQPKWASRVLLGSKSYWNYKLQECHVLIRNNKRKDLQLQVFTVTKKAFPMLLYMLRNWKNGEVHLQNSLSIYMFSELRFCVLLFVANKACAGVHKLSSLPFFGYLVEYSLTYLDSWASVFYFYSTPARIENPF